MVKNLPAIQETQETWVQSLGRGGNGNPVQYSYLKKTMDRGTWRGYSPWGRKIVGHAHII